MVDAERAALEHAVVQAARVFVALMTQQAYEPGPPEWEGQLTFERLEAISALTSAVYELEKHLQAASK